MTRWTILGLGVSIALLVAIEWRRRRQEWLEGPNRTAHLKQWYEREPYIRPAKLPPIETPAETVTVIIPERRVVNFPSGGR